MLTLILLLGCKTTPDLTGTWEGTCEPSGGSSDTPLMIRLRTIESEDGYAGFADVDAGQGEIELTFQAEEHDTRVGVVIYPDSTMGDAEELWMFGIRDGDLIRGTCGYPADEDRFTCSLGCAVLSEAEKLTLTGSVDLTRTAKPTN